MKKEVLFLLLDDFADWEGAFLATGLNTGLTMAGGGTPYVSRTLTPTKKQVRSIGGLVVTVDYTAATMPEDYAALILVGGMQWQSEEARRVVPVVEAALARGILVGAICNAASFLAAHGFLNGVRHTGNTLEMLKAWGGGRYTAEALYEERQAVRDGNIVTANGTGCLEFTRECLLWLHADTDEVIEASYQFNKHGMYRE
jgi:putative intracellular protease/amidase